MDNRQKILDCAMQLFASRGYDAAGVQEIVENAGVTKPTLYHYFGSKRGLLEELLSTKFNDLLKRLNTEAVYNRDLVLTLEKVVRIYFDFAIQHPTFYRMQLSMHFSPPQSEPNQALQLFSLEQQRFLENLFMLAAKDHGNMRNRHKAYAATFLGMINTYIGIYLNQRIGLDDELVYRCVHQYMHGILS